MTDPGGNAFAYFRHGNVASNRLIEGMA